MNTNQENTVDETTIKKDPTDRIREEFERRIHEFERKIQELIDVAAEYYMKFGEKNKGFNLLVVLLTVTMYSKELLNHVPEFHRPMGIIYDLTSCIDSALEYSSISLKKGSFLSRRRTMRKTEKMLKNYFWRIHQTLYMFRASAAMESIVREMFQSLSINIKIRRRPAKNLTSSVYYSQAKDMIQARVTEMSGVEGGDAQAE